MIPAPKKPLREKAAAWRVKELHNEVLVSALTWWRRKKPELYTDEEHLAEPTVNCSDTESRLAKAVAQLLIETRR